MFSSVPVHRDRDSQFQTFPLPLHVRPTFPIGNWFANLGTMMCGKVNTMVVKLVYSTARDIRPGGRFNNAYELLTLRALKISMFHKRFIYQCMGKIFCVEFQRYPLKFHTKYLTHTLKDMTFIQH